MYERPNFIPFDDGYTLKGYIKPVEGLHGALRFSFRPTPVVLRSQWLKAVDGVSDEEYERRTAAIFETKITQWDFKDLEGHPLSVSASNALHLHPVLFRRLEGIILGSHPTDIDPQWTQDEQQASANEALQAVLQGTDPATIQQNQDAKN